MDNIKLTKTFKSPYGDMKYGIFGNGAPVIISHGTPVNSCVWHNIIANLQDEFQFYFFDLPGYGASEKYAGQDVRLRAFAETVAAFAKYCGLENPHIVGHDFGAAAVLGAHLKHGLSVRNIVIADGVVLSPWGTEFSRHVNQHKEIFAAMPEYIHRATIKAHLRTATVRHLDNSVMDALISPWIGVIGQAAYYEQVRQYDYEYTKDLETLYPNISVPTTVIWGEEDAWVDISEGRRFAKMIKQSEFITLPDAGHFSMLDTPQNFTKQLRLALNR